jgi:multiple sugar transport system substrate-binding protein
MGAVPILMRRAMPTYRWWPLRRLVDSRASEDARTSNVGRALRLGVAMAVGCTTLGTAALTASASSHADTTTLTFVNAQDPGTFDKVIAAFEKANPTIKIKLQTLPYDAMNAAILSRLGTKDSSIDVYEVDEPRVASFASRGFLLDLSDLRSQAQGKLDTNALKITTYDGKQYAMPRWTSTQLLYYNKDLLKKAGIAFPSSEPTRPMTWEAVAAEGKKAQAAGATWGFTFDQVDRYYQLEPLAMSLGGGTGLTGTDMLTPSIANAGWTKAFTWYASTFNGKISPRAVSPAQTAALFGSGKVAFFAGGPWNAPLFDKASGLHYGVAPYPYFSGGKRATSTDSWALGISPFSKNQDAAKTFVRYMTVDPTGAWLASSRNIPVQKQAYQRYLRSITASGKQGKQLATIMQYEIAHTAVHRPTSVGYVDFESVMNKAFSDIRNGSSPAARLKQATQELKTALEKYHR